MDGKTLRGSFDGASGKTAIHLVHAWARDTDMGHGRIEERRCLFSRDLSWVEEPEKWKDLAGVGMVESTRTTLKTGKVTTERRHYIVSNPKADAASLNALVRAHWGIENKLHWVLDTASDEDRCLVNILGNVQDKKKRSMRRRRRMRDMRRAYLLDALGVNSAS